MTISGITVFILAAGKGTRLKSKLPKVLHPLFGKPLLRRVCETLFPLPVQQVFFIVGHGREQVNAAIEQFELPFPYTCVTQEPQLGTGHAVLQVKHFLAQADQRGIGGDISTVLVLSGDVPLLQPASLEKLIAVHQNNRQDITLMAATLENPYGYGRLLTDPAASGNQASPEVLRIVEEKDASASEKALNLVNAGIYCFRWETVGPLLDRLSSENAQGEFYLTDIVGLAAESGLKTGFVALMEPQEMLGVNSREDLMACHQILNRRTQQRLMAEGVTILDAAATFLSPETRIDPDTILLPGCYFEGEVTIGSDCEIGPHTTLTGPVRIGDRSRIIQSYLKNAAIGDDSSVGPFAHLRDGAILSHHVRIGNFVEVKNTRIDHHSNAAHLSYLGDAVLGSEVNMGAGTITANYDPIRDAKHQTVIEDGVKVGCNAVLVAPVRLRKHSCVAAGSVINREVEPWDLAIARPKQTSIPQWVKKVTEQTTSIPFS